MKKFLLGLVALIVCSPAWAEYKGDFYLGDTVYFTYGTYNNSTAASLQETVAGTAECHQDGSTTRITTGVTYSGTTSFDTTTGAYKYSIDTSSGFSAGSDYDCDVRGATLNGVTVFYTTVSFSIENRTWSKGRVKARGTLGSSPTNTTILAAVGAAVSANNVWNNMTFWNVTKGEKAAICTTHDSSSNDYLDLSGLNTAGTAGDVFRILTDPAGCLSLPTVSNGQVGVYQFGDTAFGAKVGTNFNTYWQNGGTTNTVLLGDNNTKIANIDTNVSSIVTAVNRVIGGTAIFESTVASVTDPTHIVTTDSPGADSYHINRRVCIQDTTNPVAIDCAWVVAFNNSTKTWTLSNQLRFTVAAADVLRIIPIDRQGF